MSKNVAVIFGGKSAEHDISIITGNVIMSVLGASSDYTPIPVYIDKKNVFHASPDLTNLDFFRSGDVSQKLSEISGWTEVTKGKFSVVWPKKFGKNERIHIDIAFPALHGTYGEDGTLAGLLRLSNTPFVGCDLEASTIAMNKIHCKHITQAAGIPSVKFTSFTADEYEQFADIIHERIASLPSPWFVKPARLGSSIGITKVTQPEMLRHAIDTALSLDSAIIVETAVQNMIEINCAVLGNGIDIEASLLEQPVAKSEFLNFEDKYIGDKGKKGSMTGDKTSTKIPAPIDENIAQRIQQLAIDAFIAIGGSGTARLDFMLDSDSGEVYLNEINPLPGSLQQHLWKASGKSPLELIEKLLQLAEGRFESQQKIATTFESSVLNQDSHSKNPS